MYNPFNNLGVNVMMRWPEIALPVVGAIGLISESVVGATVAWGASVALGSYAATKLMKESICDCEEEVMKKGWGPIPKIQWFIEHDPDTGTKRPWELHSQRGDDESTKQYYASYSTEEHALKKKALMESMTSANEEEK